MCLPNLAILCNVLIHFFIRNLQRVLISLFSLSIFILFPYVMKRESAARKSCPAIGGICLEVIEWRSEKNSEKETRVVYGEKVWKVKMEIKEI